MVSKPSFGIDKYDWLLVKYASYHIFHSLHSDFDFLQFWAKQLNRSAHTPILDVPDTARWAWCRRWLRIWEHKALASFSAFISGLHPIFARWHVPFNQFVKTVVSTWLIKVGISYKKGLTGDCDILWYWRLLCLTGSCSHFPAKHQHDEVRPPSLGRDPMGNTLTLVNVRHFQDVSNQFQPFLSILIHSYPFLYILRIPLLV